MRPGGQRRERERHVLGELGRRPRCLQAGVAAGGIERRVGRGHAHITEQGGGRRRARPLLRRHHQASRRSLRDHVLEAVALRGLVDDRDDRATSTPEHAPPPAQLVDLARDVPVDVVEEQRNLLRVRRREQVVDFPIGLGRQVACRVDFPIGHDSEGRSRLGRNGRDSEGRRDDRKARYPDDQGTMT